ncbi:ferric-chelate reductase [Aspergillus heteromorphus CBS 117.55]|uniref:ferric-chelate reductase (NADPH) n=1 Tax=Aspergillus heteromorphus CBS 117.55 TaxID=1448321 RepID=A0A317VQD7_9EURO|nr:ferric-chelate reductase [Aspergillus heteromorphus CBS 117.55]PWY75102.1 ferric-chelate reductase [Aspergillus heteromorphus CBS 117.55]
MGVDYLQPGQQRRINYHPPMRATLATPIFILAGALFILFISRSFTRWQHRRRLQQILQTNQQARFTRTSVLSATLNKHVFYAPLLSRRHSRYFQLGNGVHMGVIPLRIEAILLGIYIALNAVFLFVLVDWRKDWDEVVFQFQYSAGSMAVLNLPGLVLAAGRNNPLVGLLGIKFDSFNLMHRWVGRMVIVAGLVHTIAAVVMKQREEGGLAAVTNLVFHTKFFVCGLVAIFAFATILLQSVSPIRHAFYEAFLHTHILLAVMAFVGLWYHLEGMSQQYALLVTLVLWGSDRIARIASIIWRNLGKQRTTATVELLPGDVARVNVSLARPWSFKPGQYMYLYLPSLGLWTSHPFSVAWTAADPDVITEKRTSSDSINRILGGPQQTTMSFLIKRRDGFTSRLLQKVCRAEERRFSATALAEGPFVVPYIHFYGYFCGLHPLTSYGSVLLIAGGIGITHPMSYLHEFVNGFASGTMAVRRVTLVWVVRSLDHLSWIHPWMTTLLAHPTLQAPHIPKQDTSPSSFASPEPEFSLSIQIYLTTPSSSPEDFFSSSLLSSSSASSSSDTERAADSTKPWSLVAPPSVPVDTHFGKPCWTDILETEMGRQVGALAVSVCGPGGMGDDVRDVVRERVGRKRVDFLEESFSW